MLVWGWLGPGVPLAVAAVVAQAAVQDADQTVGQCSEGLVVGGAAAAQLVVVGPSAWGTGQGAEGPEVAGVGQALLRARRARTTVRVPEARVIGAVPA